MLLKLLMKLLTSSATKTLIAIGVNKLLEHKKDGITSDIAEVMLDGIVKSKSNPTTEDLFTSVVTALQETKIVNKEF